MTQDDQTRPDLDAALDAVVPSLTAVDDDTAAASLRRTRIALADRTTPPGARGWGWTWPAAAAVVAAIVAAVVFWPRAGVVETPRVAVRTTAPAPAALPGEPVRLAPAAPAVAPVQPTRVRPTRVARAPQIAATSAAQPESSPRRDPLVALVRAVQEIPDDAWGEALTRAQAPVEVPAVSLAPIVIPQLTTPPIAGTPAEPIAPGEP